MKRCCRNCASLLKEQGRASGLKCAKYPGRQIRFPYADWQCEGFIAFDFEKAKGKRKYDGTDKAANRYA